MRKYCWEKQIIIQAYSPLTRTDKLKEDSLMRIAEKYGKTTAQILIRWNLQFGTIPLPKANRKDHIKENINIFDFRISGEDITRFSSIHLIKIKKENYLWKS